MNKFRAAFPQASKTLPLCLLFLATCLGVRAQEFAEVNPASLDLALVQGESVVEQVSITINPFCIRPIDIDVVASDRSALVVNQTGVVLNGCGGDTSTFDIAITGTGAAQSFDLQFVDAEIGGVLAAIPVTISTPRACNLDLALSMQRGTLNLAFTIGSREPAELNLYLSAYNRTIALLQAPVKLPVIDPPLSIRSSIPGFPDLDTIGLLATITTAQHGIICSNWQTFDTSPED